MLNCGSWHLALLLAVLLVEYYLGKTDKFKAGSIIEAAVIGLALLGAYFLRRKK